MGYAITVSPAPTELLAVDDLAPHLRAVLRPPGDEQATVDCMIRAARQLAEEYTGKLLVSRSATVIYDRFPPYDPAGWDFWLTPGYPSPAAVYPNPLTRAVRLPLAPVSAVTAVRYFDAAGVEQTLTEGTDYLTHLTHQPALIYPYPGKIWPVTQFARMGCVAVEFTAGTGFDQRALYLAKQAIKLTVEYWYGRPGAEERDPGSWGDSTERGLPAGALRLLNHMRRLEYV